MIPPAFIDHSTRYVSNHTRNKTYYLKYRKVISEDIKTIYDSIMDHINMLKKQQYDRQQYISREEIKKILDKMDEQDLTDLELLLS